MKLSLFKAILFFLSFETLNLAHAADINALNVLFNNTFYGTFYRPSQCGQNAENLLRLAISKGLNLENTYVIKLENKGYSNFGLVGAQKARGRGSLITPPPSTEFPPYEPGKANWEFHAFVVADGYVFDYDFENIPRPIAFFDYLREMFVPINKQQDATFFYELQSDYEITFFPVKRSLSTSSTKQDLESLYEQPVSSNLRQYIESINR